MGPVGEDLRWQVFGPLHDYLQETFTLVYMFLRVRINFSIRLWPFYPVADKGQHTGLSLRVVWIRRQPQTNLVYHPPRYGFQTIPRNFLNHLALIDVVPVNEDTVDQWKYPPYSGHYDDTSFIKRDEMILKIRLRGGNLWTWQL